MVVKAMSLGARRTLLHRPEYLPMPVWGVRGPLDKRPLSHIFTRTVNTTPGALAGASHSQRANSKDLSHSSKGLFGRADLCKADGFMRMAEAAMIKCEGIVRELETEPADANVVALIDDLSNTLCNVIDTADLIRNVHPSSAYVDQTELTCQTINAFIQRLNTSASLYNALSRLIKRDELEGFLAPDTRYTAATFMHDFNENLVNETVEKRTHVQELNKKMATYGMQFIHKISQSSVTFPVSADIVHASPPVITFLFQQRRDQYVLETGSANVGLVLQESPHESLRRDTYMQINRPDKTVQGALNALLRTRKELAALSGYNSYAHMTLRRTMAGGVDEVHKFLRLLANKIKPVADREEAMLRNLYRLTQLKDGEKRHEGNSYITGTSSDDRTQPWNRLFLIEVARRRLNSNHTAVAKYFSVSNCMTGLGMLFQRLYGVELIDTGPGPNEVFWHPSVRKVAVREEDGKVLGHIYVDLFARRGKVSPVGLYTVQGARRIDPDRTQKPIVVLTTNYSSQQLTHGEVVDLFHEMGHAMHSMMAQTKYQSTSGTRCSMDFVEIPSTIMEKFAWDYRVLLTFAINAEGEILPEAMLENLKRERRMFTGLTLQQKILQAAVDQVYHSTDYEKLGNTSEAWRRTQEEIMCSIPYVTSTSPELRFEHLECYGGTYYTYLWCEALAGHIYEVLFQQDPFSRQAGERFRERLLAHGGAKDPWELVVDTLGYRPSLNDLVDSVLKIGGYQEYNEIDDQGALSDSSTLSDDSVVQPGIPRSL